MPTNDPRPGFDAPAEQDLLGRWPVAKTVASVVCSAPPGYSIRVGVYGSWGTGKTSVLRFVRQIAERENHLVVQFSPWGYADGRTMWLGLATDLVKVLEATGVHVKGGWKTSGLFQKALDVGRKLLAVQDQVQAVGTAIDPLVKDFLAFTTEELKTATEALGPRRLIVLVDDLDRADPKLVPHVLFALREVLDLPGISWVLAMDPDIITKALAAYHPGFSADQGDYLEKIAEFRFWLREPTPQQVWRVVEQDFERAVTVALDRRLLRQELSSLPHNPRALRAFLRHLGALTPEIKRYSDDELDHRLLLLVTLLRVEFPKLASHLLFADDLLGNLSMSFMHDDQRDSDGKEREKLNQQLSQAVETTVVQNEREAAFRLLLRLGAHAGWTQERFQHHIRLLDHPPIVTRREFQEVIDLADAEALRRWIAKWAQDRSCRLDEVMGAVFDRAVEVHEIRMQEAADGATHDEMVTGVQRCTRVLQILEWLSFELGGFIQFPQLLSPEHFAELLKSASRWAHFANTAEYQVLRQTEKQLLARIAREAQLEPLELLAVLEPWRPDRLNGGRPDDQARTQLRLELTHIVEQRAAPAVIDRFRQPSGIGAVLGIAEEAAARYLIFRGGSPLWKEPFREQVRQVIEGDDLALVDNAEDFLRRVTDSMPIRDETPAKDVEQLSKDKEVMNWFWAACTRRRPNIRRGSSIRKLRVLLERKLGLKLPEPKWWSDVEAQLNALGVRDGGPDSE